MKQALLLVLVVVLGVGLALVLASLMAGNHPATGCTEKREELADFQAIGINHTANVQVTLRDEQRRVIAPANVEDATTSNGRKFQSRFYMPVNTGATYTAEVVTGGKVIASYEMRQAGEDAAVITIFCE